jgi:ABC-type phosphate/phosphonate transport system permease subunit
MMMVKMKIEIINLMTVAADIFTMQNLVNNWVAEITRYVLDFVRFIMPLMIYVIVFKIVLSKS